MVMTYFLLGDYKILPKNDLHSSLRVRSDKCMHTATPQLLLEVLTSGDLIPILGLGLEVAVGARPEENSETFLHRCFHKVGGAPTIRIGILTGLHWGPTWRAKRLRKYLQHLTTGLVTLLVVSLTGLIWVGPVISRAASQAVGSY